CAGLPTAAGMVWVAASPPLSTRLWRAAGAARARLARFIEASLPRGRPRGLLLALTLGERGEVDSTLEDAFRSSGVTHVLSVSGLHLAVAAFLFYAGLRRILLVIPPLAIRVEARRVAALASVPAVWAYTLVTGAAI